MSELIKPLGHPIITGRPDAAQKPAAGKPAAQTPGSAFGDLLQQTLQKTQAQQLTFSRHARQRTAQRGIELTESDLDRLTEAVGMADGKGVTDTLVLMNNTAFIVNVPSRVVVTVVDGSETEGNVFTNINGAVIL